MQLIDQFDLLLIEDEELIRGQFIFALDLCLNLSCRDRDGVTLNETVLGYRDDLLAPLHPIVIIEELDDRIWFPVRLGRQLHLGNQISRPVLSHFD